MATSKEDIRGWLLRGVEEQATHLIVVCDTFDHSDYPVFVSKDEDVQATHDKYNGPNMQRVMEVYAMHLDFEMQLQEHRAFHFEKKQAKTPRKAADYCSDKPGMKRRGGVQAANYVLHEDDPKRPGKTKCGRDTSKVNRSREKPDCIQCEKSGR